MIWSRLLLLDFWMTQKYGEDLSSQPPGDNSVWEEVAGTTRDGYLRGLGTAAQISKKVGEYSGTSSASTSSAAPELTRQHPRPNCRAVGSNIADTSDHYAVTDATGSRTEYVVECRE